MRAALLMALVAAAGCDALVGGECAEGFAPSHGECAPLATHPVSDGDSSAGGQGGSAGEIGGIAGGDSEGGAGGHPLCDAGTTRCADVCVDLQISFQHCGACGHACATELCVDGACVGEPIGHVVLLGMSYAESTAPTRRALGNAAFLPIHDPVRVLDVRAHANPHDVQSVLDILSEQGAMRSRAHAVTTMTSVAEIDASEHDVLLIHNQTHAPSDWGARFADQTSSSIARFTRDGGTIIVLATSDAPEMRPFVNGLGIVYLTDLADLDGTLLVNSAPTDVIGIGVPSPALAKTATSVLLLDDEPDPTLSFVLTEASDPRRPVVIHKAVVAD